MNNDKIKAARVALGSFIKERREEMGHSQEDLARHVGVTANTVQGVETRRIAMDVDLQWKPNKALLDSKMEMSESTFNNKLRDNHTAYFTDAEIIKLKGILIELRNDLDAVTDIDFNNALKALV